MGYGLNKAIVSVLFVIRQGMMHALMDIHKQHGILGLWRGASAAVPRVSVGSAAQLSTFSASKELVTDLQVNIECITSCRSHFYSQDILKKVLFFGMLKELH